jgi:hypothetical protein
MVAGEDSERNQMQCKVTMDRRVADLRVARRCVEFRSSKGAPTEERRHQNAVTYSYNLFTA